MNKMIWYKNNQPPSLRVMTEDEMRSWVSMWTSDNKIPLKDISARNYMLMSLNEYIHKYFIVTEFRCILTTDKVHGLHINNIFICFEDEKEEFDLNLKSRLKLRIDQNEPDLMFKVIATLFNENKEVKKLIRKKNKENKIEDADEECEECEECEEYDKENDYKLSDEWLEN
jgi:hypothetical protein